MYGPFAIHTQHTLKKPLVSKPLPKNPSQKSICNMHHFTRLITCLATMLMLTVLVAYETTRYITNLKCVGAWSVFAYWTTLFKKWEESDEKSRAFASVKHRLTFSSRVLSTTKTSSILFFTHTFLSPAFTRAQRLLDGFTVTFPSIDKNSVRLREGCSAGVN